MIDGFYAMYFTGHHGSGLGLLAFTNGKIVGVDAAGGKLDGTFSVDQKAGKVTGSIRMQVPANTFLVTGQGGRPQPFVVDLPVSIPLDFGAGATISLDLPIGPINIRFEKLRELPTAA